MIISFLMCLRITLVSLVAVVDMGQVGDHTFPETFQKDIEGFLKGERRR
tara:strand:- start:63 stop:209 length:147 start_codon:yes stop_codon:yes gene_type:complete